MTLPIDQPPKKDLSARLDRPMCDQSNEKGQESIVVAARWFYFIVLLMMKILTFALFIMGVFQTLSMTFPSLLYCVHAIHLEQAVFGVNHFYDFSFLNYIGAVLFFFPSFLCISVIRLFAREGMVHHFVYWSIAYIPKFAVLVLEYFKESSLIPVLNNARMNKIP